MTSFVMLAGSVSLPCRALWDATGEAAMTFMFWDREQMGEVCESRGVPHYPVLFMSVLDVQLKYMADQPKWF